MWKARRFLEIEKGGSYDTSHNDHRVQANDASFEEGSQCHLVPAVVVSIAYYESRKHEKEIDGKIAVVDDLNEMVSLRMCFEQVKDNNH